MESEEMETFWFFQLQFHQADDASWFSLRCKRSYDSNYDSSSNSVTSENLGLKKVGLPLTYFFQQEEGQSQ